MTVLAQMQSKVDMMISERDAEIATLQDSLQKEDADIQIVKEQMEAAENKNDLSAYQSAKKKLQNLMDAKEMHTNRLKKLTDQPLISEAEYKQMISDLTSEMDAEVEDAKPRLKEASDQLASIGDQVKADAALTDQLMKQIQSELFRNKDRKKNDHGYFIGGALEYRNHYDVCTWGDAGKNYYLYAQTKEGKNKE